MKLWPFSKKDDSGGVLDRTMDLPPGVVLAAPDEPLPSTLPMINSPSQESNEPVSDPAAGLVNEQASPLPMAADAQPLVDPYVPPQSPMATLPAELPDALFSDSAPALWSPAELEIPSKSPLAAAAEPSTLDSLASDTIISPDPMMGTLWSPPVEQAALPEALPMMQSVAAPVEVVPTVESNLSDLFNNVDLLAPPPLSSEAMPDALAPLVIPEAPQLPLSESSFEQSESVCLPADMNFDPDPVPLDEKASSVETSETAITMDEMAALLPPEPDNGVELDNDLSPMEILDEQQTASEILADLLSGADKGNSGFGTDGDMSTEHLASDEGSPIDLSVGFSSDNDSFFAGASFDEMGDFGQIDGQAGLFISEDNLQTSVPDDLYLSPDAEFGSVELQTDGPVELEPSFLDAQEYSTEEPAPATDDFLGRGSMVEDDDLGARNEMNELLEMAVLDDSDGVVVGDLESYDLGHYDDPDSPIETFDLGSGEPELILSLDLDTGSAPLTTTEADSSFAFAESDFYNSQSSSPMADVEESIYESADLSEWETPQADFSFESHEPEPLASVPFVSAPPEPPKPMSVSPVPQSMNPIQESPFKASGNTQKPYTDSIADALESFEQEVLLRDTRFLKQSINNLVDRYFAQSKAEKEC